MTDEYLRSRIFSALLSHVTVRQGTGKKAAAPRSLLIEDVLVSSPNSCGEYYSQMSRWLSQEEVYTHFWRKEMNKAYAAFDNHKEEQTKRYQNHFRGEFLQTQLDKLADWVLKANIDFGDNKLKIYSWYLKNYVFHVGRAKLAFIAAHVDAVPPLDMEKKIAEGWQEDWDNQTSPSKNAKEYRAFMKADSVERLSIAISRLNDGRRRDEMVILNNEDQE